LFKLLSRLLVRFVIEPLGTAAESVALQTCDHQPQPFDLRQCRT
jgi:hypothetical protein